MCMTESRKERSSHVAQEGKGSCLVQISAKGQTIAVGGILYKFLSKKSQSILYKNCV